MSQPQQLPHGESAETLLESLATQLQINAASVKIPDFWNTSPEVWFARVEAQFGTKHISQDQTKYDYDKDNELLNLNGLGDRRPTALLRKINALNDDPRTLKRALFLANLPSEIRNILAGQEFRETEDLAEAADRVWESLSAAASVRQVQQMPHANIPPTYIGKRQHRPLGVAATGSSQASTLSVEDRKTGVTYLVDTGAEVSVYPASAQDRKKIHPTTSLSAANGTTIQTWGKRSISLAIDPKRQYNHEFYLADVTRPILGADFFTAHGLAIDLRGKRLLSFDNMSISLLETTSPQAISGLGLPSQDAYSKLLKGFPELLTPHFHTSANKQGVEHHIVTHGPPTHARARRLDQEKLAAAKAEFLQMEEMGIIRRSKSPWSPPLHVVPKPGGTITKFPWHHRLLLRLPSSPHSVSGNSCACLLVLKTLRSHSSAIRDVPFAFVYLDDILVASHSPREHSQHLRQIVTLLSSNGLVINRAKCIFGVDELDFLGHHVSSRGIAPLAERVSALRNSGAPKDRTSLQRFLGMINYYHRFLPGIAGILAPLHAQASGKGQNIEWSAECQDAFHRTKDALSGATLLHHPQPDAPKSLTVDASNTAIGAQLEQRQGRSWVPLAFFSRKLSDSEKKYSAFDRELLAAYSATKHFRHFLEGRIFTRYTDHKPLTTALTSQADRSPRQTRHLSYIAEFTSDIRHIKGKFNVVADALSRVTTVDYVEIDGTGETATDLPTVVSDILVSNRVQISSVLSTLHVTKRNQMK
ncbi:hypothetical protein RRG08_022322 [Elysia crispata]|uniref:Peptidase A2 domain-containing protein n=1 Tax=Elysia crispata TaxID=231223 RepID=A0AAE0ZQU0_9GAST|nr:hypothetical protein RRG08_022322 [Elysia crispata]